MSDLSELRTLIANATPGPWMHVPHEFVGESPGVRYNAAHHIDIDPECSDDGLGGEGDAAFVAAFDPVLCARLLDLWEAAPKALMSGHQGCANGFYACPRSDEYFGAWEDVPITDRPCKCLFDRQAPLRAALAALERLVGEGQAT